MELPTPEKKKEVPEQSERKEYVDDLKVLAGAQAHIRRLFGEDASIDYMISECKEYALSGKFSDHCYEYANKQPSPLSEEEIEKTLPKTWDGKPIWSYKDLGSGV